MQKIISRLLRSEGGSLAPIFALTLIPVLLAVGLSVDYTSATSERSRMQSALDASILSIVTLPKDTTDSGRQKALQGAFLGNGGEGTTNIDGFSLASDGTVAVKASASYAMPTNFMQLAMIRSVPIGVKSSVKKTPALVEATFKVDKVSGYWNKTMTLYGTKFTETTARKLLEIEYTYNGAGGEKGYGTTVVAKLNDAGTATTVQDQQCTSTARESNDTVPSGAFVDGNNLVSCKMTVDKGGAVIDVSQMDQLYLQMNVTTGTKRIMKSNDTATSNFLYLDGKQVESGKVVDIFTAVPCGQPSHQAWEDGGNYPPSPNIANADFFYFVTGKCAFSQRQSETLLTQ